MCPHFRCFKSWKGREVERERRKREREEKGREGKGEICTSCNWHNIWWGFTHQLCSSVSYDQGQLNLVYHMKNPIQNILHGNKYRATNKISSFFVGSCTSTCWGKTSDKLMHVFSLNKFSFRDLFKILILIYKWQILGSISPICW